MRVLAILVVAALAGCTGSEDTLSDSAGLSVPGETRPSEAGVLPDPTVKPDPVRCFPGGEMFRDERSLRTGGEEEGKFDLPEGCLVTVEFSLRGSGGPIRIAIDGKEAPLFLYQDSGAVAPPFNFTWDRTERTANRVPAPAGDYRYSFSAAAIAEFEIAVFAEPAG